MAHYFQGGYQSRAQRLRICIEAASILHAACAASWLHAAQDRYAFEDGPHLDVLQQGACCAHAAHAQWAAACASSCRCALCLFRSSGVLCLFRISTLTVQICDSSASITLGNTSKGGAPRRTPATETLLQKDVHSSELLDNSLLFMTLHDSSTCSYTSLHIMTHNFSQNRDEWLNWWSLFEAKEEARSANRGHGVLDSGPCSSSMWSP